MQLPKGRTYDVRDLDSLAPAFKPKQSRTGVYRLHFANGEAYCGQAKNVLRRYAKHRRTWDDIESIDFFPVAQKHLNEAEQLLITETEAVKPLRNKMLTNRPRGNEVVEIITSAGSTVAFPWERERAKGATKSYADAVDSKLAELLSHPYFPLVRSVVGWYIAHTMPDPAATAGQVWTSTCLPSTNHTKDEHRLLCISCGNLETLFVVASQSIDFENDPDAFVMVRLNTVRLDNPEQFHDPEGKQWEDENDPDVVHFTGRWVVTETPYRGEEVTSFAFGLDTFAEIIDGEIDFPHFEELVEKAYELNVRLMRRGGSTMYTRFHNEKLADLLVAEAVVWGG